MRIFNYQPAREIKGFTIIELLVVMGIMSVLATLGLLVTLDLYRSYAFNSERDTLVSILQKARSKSLNNLGQTAHGVYFENDKYILFDRSGYGGANSQDQVIPADTYINHSSPGEIVFAQVSGNVVAGAGTITLGDGKRSTSIVIGANGRVDW